MKVTCPHCQGKFELEEYLKDTTMIQVIKMMPEFVPHQKLVWEYVELFHIGPPLRARKLLRLLVEVMGFFKNGFVYQRVHYEISKNGVAAALAIVCNQIEKGPLTNHNYLKKVAIEIAEEEAKKRRIDEDKKSREKHEARQTAVGAGVERVTSMPAKVRELLDNIG